MGPRLGPVILSEAVVLEFAPTEAELRLAAESLREDVERFPMRARR